MTPKQCAFTQSVLPLALPSPLPPPTSPYRYSCVDEDVHVFVVQHRGWGARSTRETRMAESDAAH